MYDWGIDVVCADICLTIMYPSIVPVGMLADTQVNVSEYNQRKQDRSEGHWFANDMSNLFSD